MRYTFPIIKSEWFNESFNKLSIDFWLKQYFAASYNV